MRLLPFIKFKKTQAEAILNSIPILRKGLGEKEKRQLVKNIIVVQSENYSARKKKSESELLHLLGLTP